jgi:N-sulfoglucosamine sulfohydrolase
MKVATALRICLVGIWLLDVRPAAAVESARPNILWLTAEDLSPHLGCYGDSYARTPVLDELAGRSVRYTRAFATAPVCSPARSTLITGMYATSLGTQRLRSQFPVHAEIRGFSAWLREAGYHCSNNVKTDYNLRDEPAFIEDAWDASSPCAHWRNRKPGQPFFAVFNFMTTHQSRTGVWPHEEFEREIGSELASEDRHDPAGADLPPYYPDTAEARRAWARYHDCITKMDQEAGELLAQLDADGLADNTIVFFYGDHGMGMPRGKRVLHDSGLHVPLLIHVPKRWRHLAPAPAGGTSDRLVSFVDFAPTVLSLCGVHVPDRMQGMAFLGPAAGKPRSYVYGARDRVDEVFDLARSVRDDRWLYIRNFMPHLSWMQPERFSDGSTFRQEFKQLAAAGQLGPGPMTYAASRRALEELYDTQSDTHQLNNLVDRPEHQERLASLRAELRRWLIESRDTGFLTEPQVWERIGQDRTPQEMARDPARYDLERLIQAADKVGLEEVWKEQVDLLAHADDGVRYWAAVGLHATARAGGLGAAARSAVQERLDDSSPVVRIELASALAALGPSDDAFTVLAQALKHSMPEVALHAARAVELLGERARPLLPVMRQTLEDARANKHLGDLPMFIRFSLEAALDAPWTKDADRIQRSMQEWSAGLSVHRLATAPSLDDVIVSQTLQDDGGNTRFRFYPQEYRLGPDGVMHDSMAAREYPNAHRYRLQDRDLGQIFTIPANLEEPLYLRAVTLRVGPMPDANEGGADGAAVSMQLFEVHGEPVISDNGTSGTDSSRWRTFDPTRATTDDYVTGQSFVSLGVARGGLLPVGIDSHAYMQWRLQGEVAIRLEPGRSYAFMVMFDEPGEGRGLALANRNTAGWAEPIPLGPYRGGYALRRMGESSRFEDVFFDPDDRDDATVGLAAATLPEDPAKRAAIEPGTLGYPDVDTYRDFVFWIHAQPERQ